MNISGGEPTLDNDLVEIIKFLKSKKVAVSITTNGTILKKNSVKDLAQSGLDSILISVDSANPLLHDMFRGVPGSWYQTMDFIGDVRKHEIPFGITHTIHSKNYQKFGAMVELAKELNASNIYVLKFISVGEGSKHANMALTLEQEKFFVKQILLPLQAKHQIDFMTSVPSWNLLLNKTNESTVGCSHGHVAFVSHKGDVMSCPMVNTTVGTIDEGVLEVDKFARRTKEIRGRKYLTGDCAVCPKKYQCGGCIAISESQSEDPLTKGECWIFREELNHLSR